MIRFLATSLVATVVVVFPGCCNIHGSKWLHSCVKPSTEDMYLVAGCLEAGHKTNTPEYAECLQKGGIDDYMVYPEPRN